MIPRMGIMYDYFAADSDERAAATINLPGGPGGALPVSQELQEAIRSGDREAIGRHMRARVHLSEHGLSVLSVKGIEPVVQMATLEGILTGERVKAIIRRPRNGHVLASQNDGMVLVVSLTDELQTALADAAPERLAGVAVEWSQTGEFRGRGDTAVLTNFLQELAELARGALDRRERLYCWICV
jgi:hypothetical protein